MIYLIPTYIFKNWGTSVSWRIYILTGQVPGGQVPDYIITCFGDLTSARRTSARETSAMHWHLSGQNIYSPTYTCPPIFGMIYLIPTYIFKNCLFSGAQKPSDLHSAPSQED